MHAHRHRRPRRPAVIVRAVEHSLDRSGALLLAVAAAAVLVVLLLVVTAAPAHADGTTTVNGDYALDRARRLELGIPFGELHVKGTDGNRVRVHVEASCKNGDCDHYFKDLRLESSNRGGTLRVKLEGSAFAHDSDANDDPPRERDRYRERGHRHGEIDGPDGDLIVTVEVPRSLDVELNMGAGEIEIDGLREDLSIDLGAGEINVRMAARHVGTVDVHMAVGETTIHEGGRTREYARVLGGPIHWRDGKGDAGIDVNVGAGEVDVTLE
ncbi:MAG TPA: hypothetical protein VFS09_00035 [Candidatus Eisenbacteria bacterium]|nr:hypothetical protein [Candidatus Eisenbacteria bacterium]